MSNKYNAELLLTQHYATPIRFYLHRRNLDLSDIKTNFHNRISGIDNVGKNELIHKEEILFTFPVSELETVEPYHEILKPVEDLRLNKETESALSHCIDDNKLHILLRSEIDFVTRRGHVIQGILEAFDKEHLFIQNEKEIILVYRKGLLGLKEDVVACLNHSSPLEELRTKRKKWVEVNRENNFEDGIKHLLTELYPDNAHFIYELLQNAEDAGASAVKFILDNDRVTFEHNGDRLFSFNDVVAITSIGFSTKKDDHTNIDFSTKKDDHTKIGKFGIGFKAVYAYTVTPDIESGEFHFCIRDMVIPDTSNLFQASLGEEKTRFILPFDNPKKPAEKAFAEIEQNLQQLNHGTLLFLSNIRKIEFQLPNSTTGILELTKSKNNDRQIEITVKRPDVHIPVSIHYLRFEKVVSVIDEDKIQKECKIAVAFGMEKNDKGEWKVNSLNPGQVFIYFPAANAISNLKFHLHAPFASTVARDSVRESPANDELRNHISDLIAESMSTIRDRGMLDVEFLATLPNDKEHIPTFYQPILKRIVEEFNTKKLVPMKQESHAIASESYRTARRERILSVLINDQDLAILLERDKSSLLWIANPPQINQREDNFLSMLDISEWTIEDLIGLLETQPDKVTGWLKEKVGEWGWHQQLYALFGDFLSGAPSYPRHLRDERKDRLSKLRIVCCSDGEYRIGSECHFSQDYEMPDKGFNYVVKDVYSSGQNKNHLKKARVFLEEIGVREVDEAERVKRILHQRYTEDRANHVDKKQHIEDMHKFIALVENEPGKTGIFKDYNIFKTTSGHFSANCVYLDSPYLDTSLSICYEDDIYVEMINVRSSGKSPYFSLKYENSGIDLKKLGEFAKKLEARTELEAIWQEIPTGHSEIKTECGWENYQTSINSDYFIPEFRILLNKSSIEKSKLIWQTMRSLSNHCLEARFKYNRKHTLKLGASSLVHDLRKAKWVPQKNGDTVSFVRPCDALVEILPKGFTYEPDQEWLKAIEFGKKTKEQRVEHTQRNQNAKELGYDSGDEAEEVAAIYMDWKAQGKSPKELHRIVTQQERRAAMLIAELDDSHEKEYEQRARNVRISRGRIDPVTPLRTLYALDGNSMNCQMCKQEMPFKKRNSDDDYFEAVEGLRKDHFPIEHEAQYLALCPVCSAKYKEYVKKDPQARKTLYNTLKDSNTPEVSLHVNGETIHIWFEEKHWHDLKTVIYYYENIYSSENSSG